MNAKYKYILVGVIALLLLVCGFFIGRKTVPGKVIDKPIYIPGDTVEVEVPTPFPVEVVRPADTLNIIKACIESGKYYELFPLRVRDSIVYVTKADTAAVLTDWATIRYYDEPLFDIDTVGTARFKAKVQYNRLSEFSSTFVPMTKVIVEPSKIKKYSPFVGIGLTTMPTVAGQAGMFFDDKYGVSALYQYDWQNKNNIIGIMYLRKF